MKNLKNLDLQGNPIADQPQYKEKIYELFPDLEVLDGYDKEGNEVMSEDEEEEEEEFDDEEQYGDEDDDDDGELDEE